MLLQNIRVDPCVSVADSRLTQFWDDAIVPALVDYIRIPAKSPHFDKAWAKNGHIDAAVELAAGWCRKHAVPGMKLEVVRLEGRTPVLLHRDSGDPGAAKRDRADVRPPRQAARDDRLARGLRAVDAASSTTASSTAAAARTTATRCSASLAALRALHEDKRPHARIVILIECCEESGSYDLPAYLEALAPRIGTPDLVIGLDSGCGNYEQLWGTTSLRGLVNGVLTVEVLTEGVHSGDASGVVASSFRIARMLLERIDAADTGIVKHSAFHAPDPARARRAGEARRRRCWARRSGASSRSCRACSRCRRTSRTWC